MSGAAWIAAQPGERPEPPLTLLGDVGGGALYLTLGVLAAAGVLVGMPVVGLGLLFPTMSWPQLALFGAGALVALPAWLAARTRR